MADQNDLPNVADSVREGAERLRAFIDFLTDPRHAVEARVAVLSEAVPRMVAARRCVVDDASLPIYS